MSKPTIIVVGNGMVGYKFCEKLVARSANYNIIVFGEEPRRAQVQVRLMLGLHQLHALVARELLVRDREIALLLVSDDGRVQLVPDLGGVLALAERHEQEVEHVRDALDFAFERLLGLPELERERAHRSASGYC